MFTFDNTTIIISVVLLVVALLTSFLNPFFRKVRIQRMVCQLPQPKVKKQVMKMSL